ncbi:MAG: enolase C-terminal domain-like protein [Planctomycetaceae bacterium]
MKIAHVETIPVLVPLKQGLTTKTAHGEHVVSPYVIVRLKTDDGLVGVGEATLAARWSGETSQGCRAVVEGLMAPLLIGQNPLDFNRLRHAIERCCVQNPFTKAAVEMALWDLCGKALGVPVYQLLGGKVRDEIPIKMVVGAFPVPKALELAKQFLDWGVKCLKVKVGTEPTGDLERVKAVRELAGPNIPIGVDVNCGWDLPTARNMLDRLAELDVFFVEQPIPQTDVHAMAELRRMSRIPLMADESIFTLNDAWQLTRAGAVDILSVYPGKHGGIAATLEIAAVAKSAGICCSIGSNLELGVGTAAMLHVAAASKTIDSEKYPADLIGPLYHEVDLLTKPLSLGPAAARVPEGPGLGVELDEDQLKQYADASTRAQELG